MPCKRQRNSKTSLATPQTNHIRSASRTVKPEGLEDFGTEPSTKPQTEPPSSMNVDQPTESQTGDSPSMNDERRPAVQDVDAKGDVVFDAGEPSQSLLVRAHSKALAEASLMFAALLGPNLSEGQSLSAESPKAIPLLCSVIYGKCDAHLSVKHSEAVV